MFEERTMKSEKIYEGKIVNLRIDTIEIPEKRYSKREIVEHPGSVGIIAITEDDCLILVRQYRKAVEDFLLEIPAGKLEVNEEPRETGIRELQEETGYVAAKIKYLMDFYSSPGFTDEKISIFLAEDLEKVGENPDEGEFIQIEKVHIDDLESMIKKGEVLDSKTIIASYIARDYISKNK